VKHRVAVALLGGVGMTATASNSASG